MKKVALTGKEMDRNERLLLASAYKNMIGSKRSSFRLIISTLSDQDEIHRDAINIAKETIENEIKDICLDVLDLVYDLLRTATSTEYRVYLLKLQGDYIRYQCELKKGKTLNDLIERAHECYINATALGNKCLTNINQTRLGLALNFSVFFYEIVRDKGRACAIARDAYESGALKI